MADKKSLSDLGELTNPKPEAPAVSEAPAAEAAPASAESSDNAPASAGGDGRRGREDAVSDHGASTQGPQIAAVLREQQLDKHGRAYATGRRKDAVARVWLKPGSGKVIINGREQEVYFARPTLRLIINQVFDITDRRGQYDVEATVKGGGLSGQARRHDYRKPDRRQKDWQVSSRSIASWKASSTAATCCVSAAPSTSACRPARTPSASSPYGRSAAPSASTS